jgi:CHAD domain-containing protein
LFGWFRRRFSASKVEVEAKFQVADEEVLRRLAQATELAGFPLSAGKTQNISDTYLDTARWRVLGAGYACRRRVGGARVLVTLKQLSAADDIVHRREEFEVELSEYLSPAEWPDSPARSKVLDIIGDEPLVEALDLRQTRIVRLVGSEENPVAELSLDEVHLDGSDVPDRAHPGGDAGAGVGAQARVGPESPEPSGADSHFYEVEVELRAGGTERDLAVLVAVLQKEWRLEPQPLSKFERAVALAWEKPVLEMAPVERSDETRGPGGEAGEIGKAGAIEMPQTNGPTAGESRSDAASDEAADTELPWGGHESAETCETSAKHPRKHDRKQRFLGDGLPVLEKPGLTAHDTMAEAADKTLLYHLQRVMLHEPGTREGEDAEELHDMRVATRRMRAAVRVFRDYLDMDAFRPYLKIMQETGRELGTVRDLDVFRIKTQVYIDSLPPEEQSGLDPLLEAWANERERARAELIEFLDSSRYQHFKERFEHFLRDPGAGARSRVAAAGEPLPSRVDDVLPAVLFERLATVKAFDEWITRDDAPLIRFHQLRIASKGLRYTLEFFQEVLGSDCKALVDKTKLLQDHLGDLQDAVVTCDVLLGFLSSGTWGPPRLSRKDPRQMFPVNAPGLATYLAVKQNEIERLMNTFGPVWSQIRGSEFSRPLAALVGAL